MEIKVVKQDVEAGLPRHIPKGPIPTHLLLLAENVFDEKIPFLERKTYLNQITSKFFRDDYLKLTQLLYCVRDELIQQQTALVELKASDRIASSTDLNRTKIRKMIKEKGKQINLVKKERRIIKQLREQEPSKTFLWLSLSEHFDQMEMPPPTTTKGRLDVKEVLSKVDMVEVIGSYLPLKRRGRLYVALCPFHEERTPSFTIYPESQNFHCFGCRKHGDIINFLMEYKNYSFLEALQEVAQRTRR